MKTAPGGARPRDGILTLSGHGVRVSVNRGYLTIEDGLGEERYGARFSRIDQSLKRLVLIGSAGSVTLDALQWLHDVGVPLIHLKRDGTLLFVAARSGTVLPALRRNQAMARETGFAGRIAEDLIRRKVEGQLALLDRLPPNRDARPALGRVLAQLASTSTLEQVRKLEAVAAGAYWKAWRDVSIPFARGDAKRRPAYWRQFGTRVSPLTGAGARKAVNPTNAILNYLYAILEAEARIAALSVGADPMLGFIHTDQRNRDSLACDLMEPARPRVDAYVLDLFERREFRKEDFFELPDGQCRLMPPLTEELIKTGARWARLVLPEAQRVVATLLESKSNAARAKTPYRADGRRTAGNPMGGQGVSTRPRRGSRVVTREHRTLTPIQAGEAPDPRRGAEAGAKRRVAMRQIARDNKRWGAGKAPTDPDAFRAEILPKIQGVPLKVLVEATGLTKSACSRIRAGETVPHPRHWAAFASHGSGG
ncbi:MAG: CRISPR-associated endonuclease Cas1 [Gemmatimonadales bacterium]